MAKRAYGQYCGLAHALELVGERWALLVVRDLMVGPRRYTDLRRGLPRIPTNILAVRLKELEQTGIVRRRILPRPAGSVVYELTEYGRGLEDAVLSLGRWGAQSLGEPGPADIVTTDSLIMALRTTFCRDAASGLRAAYELRVGGVVVHVRVDDGVLETGEGAAGDPDLIIDAGPALWAMMAGHVDPADAIADGDVRVTGDPRLLARFVDVFHIPSVPAAAPA